MKKYMSVILSVIFMFSACRIYAEGENEEGMSIDVVPVSGEILDAESIIDQDNSMSDIEVSEKTDKEDVETAGDDNNDSGEELYDLNPPSVDRWEEAGALASGRADFDILVINKEMYAVGGFGNSGYVYSIEKYNKNTASWENITSLPKAANGFSAVAVDDSIYVIGGYMNNTYLNDVQIYNTLTGEWTVGTPMLERRDKAASLCTDNKIYVFGGRDAKGFVNSYEYYDMSDDTWNKVTSGFDESLIRVGAKAGFVKGFVCLYGGLNQKYEYMGVNIYLASDMEQMTQMTPKGREYVSVTWGKEKALVFSYNSTSSSYTIEEMIIEEDVQDTSTVFLEAYPATLRYMPHVIYDGYLYCAGGYDIASRSYNSNTYKYSVYYGDFVKGDGQINGVVTAYGNTVTLNVENDKDYYIFVNVNNMSTFEGYTFTVEYPKGSFSVIDACALTDDIDRRPSKDNVRGTDIRITEAESNGLSFVCSEDIPSGKKVSETVNVIWLRANSSGQRTITYRMTK